MPVLGKVGLVNRGTYSASAQYTALDFVLYNGSTYVAIKNVSGIDPSNDGVNWQTMALGTSMSLENSLEYDTPGELALDAAQGPIIRSLIDEKAPVSHASTTKTYGQGNASNYGHVKLSDTYASIVSGGNAEGGIGASQNALYSAYSNRAPISHSSTSTTYGQGNASNFGHVKLSDTYATKVTNGAAANGLAASQNALYNTYQRFIHTGDVGNTVSDQITAVNNKITNLASYTVVTGGRYLFLGVTMIHQNVNGYRRLFFSETSTGDVINRWGEVVHNGTSGTQNRMQVFFTKVCEAGEKIYLNLFQNSGSSLNTAANGIVAILLRSQA